MKKKINTGKKEKDFLTREGGSDLIENGYLVGSIMFLTKWAILIYILAKCYKARKSSIVPLLFCIFCIIARPGTGQTPTAVGFNNFGAAIALTLALRSKADIIIQIGWQVHKADGGKAVTFILEAFDSYTSKRIATATGTSEASDDIVPVILENAVKDHIDAFDSQMDRYFAGLVQNGREIVLTVRCWDSWENDLETEYDGEELTDCIQDWLYDNTVNGSFNLTDGTESFLQFEQVRIPLTDERGRAIDARTFATDLRKYLQEPPFEITSKVMMRGLGEAILVLGEK